MMLPAALSIVMNMFEEGAERNKAPGIWRGLGAAGATVGLITGGLLNRYASTHAALPLARIRSRLES